MSRGTNRPGAAQGSEGGARGTLANCSHDLLRCSHIFASVVRDVLESKPLREASPASLTPSQLHLLALMTRDGQHQVGEAADFLGVSSAAATKNIDKLERLGLVARGASPGDRRATMLTVSPKGRRLVRKYEQLKAARLSVALKGLRAEEIRAFTRMLERFTLRVLEREPSADRFCLRCDGYIEAGCPVGQLRDGCPYLREHEARATAPTPEGAT